MIRPRRSVLYMPGSNPRALEKAPTLPVDALILDLEDAVAPDTKTEARRLVHEAVRRGGFGHREIVIRVNALSTPWGEEDLAMAMAAAPDAILLPKVSHPEDLLALGRRLAAADVAAHTRLWVMMETPQAILGAQAIAAAALDPATRLSVLVLGTNDLMKETRVRWVPGRQTMLGWLTTCVLAARAYGLDVIDGVFNDFKDTTGFAEECSEARDLGMDGKTLIHPAQIEPCNASFTPGVAEVAWCRIVIDAFDRPENAGRGALQIDGRMVERLHAEMARRVVAIADAITARGEALR